MAKFKCSVLSTDLTAFRYRHAKRDGIWLELEWRHGFTRPTAATSRPSDIRHQLTSRDWFREFERRARQRTTGACLWGELWVPGYPASEVKRSLARGGPLRFDAFASPDLPTGAALSEVKAFAASLGQAFAPWVEGARDAPMEPLPADCEGWVFKNGNLLDWAKWKPTKTIDCVVTGLVDGNGKYLGQTGALLVSVLDDAGKMWEVASVSGMTDMERALISDNEPGTLRRVVEVEYQYVGSGGRLRHPRFKRWRDDKTPLECSADQDPELAACVRVRASLR